MTKDIRTVFTEAGIIPTPARIAVLRAFPQNCQPVDGDYLLTRLKKSKRTNINKVTMYRALAAFELHNLIRRVDIRRDSVHYERVYADRHHHHIVCRGCGCVEHFHTNHCVADQVSKKALANSRQFASINEHSFELFGLCKACAK